MNKSLERLYNGIIKENPTLVLMLGMCPTLAVTTSAINGFGMGMTTTVVLALSNMIISMLRKIIPDRVRIPAFIVIIASFVTMVELLLEGFIPSLYSALGLYIPLIVVNCIILGRAESYAYKNPVIPSFFDGLGMGFGFTIALTIIGLVRELIGAGEAFGIRIMLAGYEPVRIFVMAPGAFFVLACLVAIQNKVKIEGEKKGKDMSKVGSGCTHDCMSCGEEGCSSRKFYDDTKKVDKETKALPKTEAGKKSEPIDKAIVSEEGTTKTVSGQNGKMKEKTESVKETIQEDTKKESEIVQNEIKAEASETVPEETEEAPENVQKEKKEEVNADE